MVRPLPNLGFSLQAGAFAKVDHAVRLSQTLDGHDLEATYYRSEDGLYRVRFGNFPTRSQAQARGEALKAEGILDAYLIVSPTPSESVPGPRGENGGLRARLVASAKGYLGVPYLFGGTRERGFDCSGFTGAVYRLNGLQLPRTSRAQFQAGSPVDLKVARPGDLIFFGTGGSSTVNHVGLLVGTGTFIHAPRPGHSIRKDDLKDPYFKKCFLGIRSFL